MSRTIAIGDVHGCLAALEALVAALAPQADDELVFLGDFIDRGPHSRGVIDFLLHLREQVPVVTLMGNHELMMLWTLDEEFDRQFWLNCGGRATLASYGDDLENITPRHRNFLRDCVLSYETNDQIFVHANYAAHLPMSEQDPALILWEHISDTLPPAHTSGKTVFVGHTPQRNGEVLDLGHLLCIDTFCFGGGWLTAIDVDSREIWQANFLGKLREL